MSGKKQRRNLPPQRETNPAEVYRSYLHPDAFQRLLETIERPFPTAIRINTLKISLEEALRIWPERYGWKIQPVPFCPSAWQIRESAIRPSHTPEYKMGYFYIQDAASTAPVELFDFSELDQPLILELAAAPGGKTTHLASRSMDRGLLLANDSSHSRIPALQTALLDWGAMNSLVTNLPGEKFGEWFPNQFDLVLLDAPCSMENLNITGGGHGKRPVSSRERQGLAQRQFRLLASALQAVRPGGQVVYSTCTLAVEEDEAVLDHILRRFEGQVTVLEHHLPLEHPVPGLLYLGEEDFNPQVGNALRMWPHLTGASGFFCARLTKNDPSPVEYHGAGQDVLRWSFEKYHLTRLNPSGQTAFFRRIEDQYGFNLTSIFEGQGASVWKRDETYYALPDQFLRDFNGLPVENPGFWLAEDTHDGLIPSHELVARFGQQFSHNVIRIGLEEAQKWMGGQDLPTTYAEGIPVGMVVVVMDEWKRVLGRGKIQRERIKNMLPRRLVHA